ncbi:twin transmembrane helix small protein [Sandaracinobacter neustonicus]|uniref:Twin transmembrane helix small protein n=1 Tax=Sandaracinobacter neustonicus TaxID=1715348 RepID=A0A501XIF0_9SPHN|nr:twin transmembrane helix small protein [Sandaracinobacter neustonicus]TPE60083.1 twin transmembrane helix small protein [Sandaracinobacter neustonicus]
MNGFIIALIILAALATAYVLVRGIITMAQGKDLSGEQSNKYMSMRVGFQALTILLVILLLAIGGRGLSGS